MNQVFRRLTRKQDQSVDILLWWLPMQLEGITLLIPIFQECILSDRSIWGEEIHSVEIGIFKTTQIARFMGPTWDPPGSCRPQVGPMLTPWTLLSGKPQVILSLNTAPDVIIFQAKYSAMSLWRSQFFSEILTIYRHPLAHPGCF